MNHKVLLADDSLTIQKVIKITLANQPYDITECSTEDELFHQLPLIQPKIVYLDFNLSEKYTGYELTSKIKSICPSTKVLLLLGTFDSVDDHAVEKSGASDKIVKPFDSNKFIAISKKLIETFAPDEEEVQPSESLSASDKVEEESPEDQWQMSHTSERVVNELKPEEAKPQANPLNALTKEMSDWGMSVPGVINDNKGSDKLIDLPPVIGEVKSLDDQRQKTLDPKYETKFPDNDDLDYPTIEEMKAAEPVLEEKTATSSKLVSLDAFKEDTLETEASLPAVGDEADISSIEAQIRDEVEEDLWKADEFEDLKQELSNKIEDIQGDDFRPVDNHFDEDLFKPLDENESIQWAEPSHPADPAPVANASVNMDEIRQEMEAMIKKYVKEYMDEMFQKNVDKISWEVIPDLAENLIRQELGKISNKILNDQN